LTLKSKTKLKVNLLFGRASPRSNIPRVEYQNQFLPCDRLYVRFVLEWNAYQIMRNYFLQHQEYTHLVLATDDIIVYEKDIKRLQQDLEINDFPVLAGVMNVDQGDEIFLAITQILMTKQRDIRKPVWIKREDLFDYPNIFTVAFNGFSLIALRRDIVDRQNFDADKVFQGFPPHRGASLDVVFAHWCAVNKIPIRVDKRIMLTHKRKAGQIRVKREAELLEFCEKGFEEAHEIEIDPFR